jgi:hypothetical protein
MDEFLRGTVQLRLSPTHNNQQLKINWADDYDFAARLGALGAVAQLGERLDGIQKARGSNPLGSIPSIYRESRNSQSLRYEPRPLLGVMSRAGRFFQTPRFVPG